MSNSSDEIVERVITLDDYQPHPRNYNKHPNAQIERLVHSLDKFGQVRNIVVWRKWFIAGHGVAQAAISSGRTTLRANVIPDDWPEERVLAYLAADNELGKLSQPDDAQLLAILDEVKQYDHELLLATGFDQERLDDLIRSVEAGLEPPKGPSENTEGRDVAPEIERADELQKKWLVQDGQIWKLGDHLVVCGDCTVPTIVSRLLDAEAVLCHADPPYGMGKEKDGVANDNLYDHRLDEFQMKWWRACRGRLSDNASVYIWGNAPDLWRLWYKHLSVEERLTHRNEIAWDKESGMGMRSDAHRMYPTVTERCLFFMIGEQGFNDNADNYWEGWEGIRSYLEVECKKMGWGPSDIQRICGVGMYSHWFTKSQWRFIPEEHYRKLQAAAGGAAFRSDYNAFKSEYDELKTQFYGTRAYFDNTHDAMSDVWRFPRVVGEERYGHATPKPVAMIERAIKSSSPEGAIVYSPFLGSGTDLIACENLGRKCRAVEIHPPYVAVALERWHQLTGKMPTLVDG